MAEEVKETKEVKTKTKATVVNEEVKETKEVKTKTKATVVNEDVVEFFEYVTPLTVERIRAKSELSEAELEDYSTWSDETWEKYESYNKPTQKVIWNLANLQEKIIEKTESIDPEVVKEMLCELADNL